MKKHFRFPCPDGKTDQTDKYLPVRSFFNIIPDSRFIHIIGMLLRGIGYGFSYPEPGCTFSNDLEYDEEPFEGIKFYFFDDEIIVDYPEFFDYVKRALGIFLEENPEKEDEVKKLLDKVEWMEKNNIRPEDLTDNE